MGWEWGWERESERERSTVWCRNLKDWLSGSCRQKTFDPVTCLELQPVSNGVGRVDRSGGYVNVMVPHHCTQSAEQKKAIEWYLRWGPWGSQTFAPRSVWTVYPGNGTKKCGASDGLAVVRVKGSPMDGWMGGWVELIMPQHQNVRQNHHHCPPLINIRKDSLRLHPNWIKPHNLFHLWAWLLSSLTDAQLL